MGVFKFIYKCRSPMKLYNIKREKLNELAFKMIHQRLSLLENIRDQWRI